MRRLIDLGVIASPKQHWLWLLNLNSPSLHLDFVARTADMQADVVFCDGGYRRSIAALDPRNKRMALVGDLDSLGEALAGLPATVELLRDPTQNRNDLHKGLDLVCSRISQQRAAASPDPRTPVVVVNGATGGRLDHQM